jgi:hypothetical protein
MMRGQSKRPGHAARNVHQRIKATQAALLPGPRDAEEAAELAAPINSEICPGLEVGDAGAMPGERDGATYARALLERIGAGTSSPAELATLMQFLHSGSLLHGACAVIFYALAAGSGRRPAA